MRNPYDMINAALPPNFIFPNPLGGIPIDPNLMGANMDGELVSEVEPKLSVVDANDDETKQQILTCSEMIESG